MSDRRSMGRDYRYLDHRRMDRRPIRITPHGQGILIAVVGSAVLWSVIGLCWYMVAR